MASPSRCFPFKDNFKIILAIIEKYIEENPEVIENILFKKRDDTKQRTLDSWLQKSSNKSKETTKTSTVKNNVNDGRSTDRFLREIPEPSASTFADSLHIALQQCGSPEIQYLDSTELTPYQIKNSSEVISVVDPQNVSDSDLQQAFIDERREIANENNSLEIENDICIVYHEPGHHDIVVQNASLSEPVINVNALNTTTNLDGFEFLDECGSVTSGYHIPSNLFVVSDSNVSKNNPQHEDGQNCTLSNLNNLNLEYPGVEPLPGVDGNLSLTSECTENIPEVKDIVFTDSASRAGNDSEEHHDSYLKESPLSSKKSGFTSEESCMKKLVSMSSENLVNNEFVENQKLNFIQHSAPTIDRPTNTSPKLPGENVAMDMMGQEVLIIKQNDMNFEIGGNEEFSLIETGTSEIKIEHVRMPKKKNIKEKNTPNKNLSDQVPEGTAMRRKLHTHCGTKLYLQSLRSRSKCRSEKKIQVLSNELQSSHISDIDTDAIGSETHSMKEKVKPNSIKMTETVELEGRNTRSRKHLNRQSTDKTNDFSALSKLDLKGKDSPCSTVCSSTNDEINNVKISKEKDSSTSYNLRRRKLSSSSIVPLKKVKQTKRSECRDSFTKEVNCDEQSSEFQSERSGEGSGSVSSTTKMSTNSRIIRRTKSYPSKFGNQQTNMPILKSSSQKKLPKTCFKPKQDKDETSVLSSPLRSSESHIETSLSLEKKRVKSSKTHRKKSISKQSNKTKDSTVIEKQKALVNVSCDTSKLSSDIHSSLSLQLDESNIGSVCSDLNDPSISSQKHTVDPSAESGTSTIEGNDKLLNALEVKLGNADCQSTKSTQIPCEKLRNGTEPTLMEKLTSLNLGNDVNMELVDERALDFFLMEAAHFRRWEGTERMEAFWKQVQANPKGKVRLIPSAEMPNPENGPGLHLYCGRDPED